MTAGDGTDEVDGTGNKLGMCQQEDPDRRCLSTGECRRCKFVSGTGLNRYEGCEITSGIPICDANKDTTAVEYDTSDYLTGSESTYAPEAGNAHLKNPNCVKCKKAGKTKLFVIHFYCMKYLRPTLRW